MTKRKDEITTEEELAVDGGFTGAEPGEDAMLCAEDIDTEKPKRRVLINEDEGDEPEMSDPGWNDFVMRQFMEDELDGDGHPKVHGLRRVTKLLLGPILKSNSKSIQAPHYVPGLEGASILSPATVEHHLSLLMCRVGEHGLTKAYKVEYTEVADVHDGNTDPDFARHGSATASTKAEARCLRKALQLKTVASDEVTKVPLAESGHDGLITPEQINFINILCHRHNINVIKYINSGKEKYNRVEDIPKLVAHKMNQHLSSFQNQPTKIPAGLRGFDPIWRNTR